MKKQWQSGRLAKWRSGPRGRGRLAAAFTLMELMVVIIILVILMLVAIPTFSVMMYSTESSTAEGLLRAAIRSGRDAALRSSGDADAAVVFFYEPGGRLTMTPCVRVGALADSDRLGNFAPPVMRDVFVPIASLASTQLPKNWTVRGYASPYSIASDAEDDWYESSGGVRYDPNIGNWLFPETGFYDLVEPANDEGRNRQTFMLRFEAGTGLMKVGSSTEALVLGVRPSSSGRPVLAAAWTDVYTADDYVKFVQRALTDRSVVAAANPTAAQLAAARRRLLGSESADTVLARPVSQVALCDESRLAAALGTRVNRDTGCMYLPYSVANPRPTVINGVDGLGSQSEVTGRINRWVQGDTDLDGVYESVSNQSGATLDRPESRIFSIDRNTAAIKVLEVQP